MPENKSYTVIIDPYAVSKLNAHAVFLSQVSDEAANRLIDSFYQAAKSLEAFPQRNPFIPQLDIAGLGYRKLLFEKRYLLLYMIQSDHVYVDDVVDCRENYNWLLQFKVMEQARARGRLSRTLACLSCCLYYTFQCSGAFLYVDFANRKLPYSCHI